MPRSKELSFLDEIIDRRQVPALKMHKMVLGEGGEKLFAAGVADMDFKAPDVVLNAMEQRLAHSVFGYEAVHGDLFDNLCKWQADRHGWQVDQQHILRAPNILNALAMAVNLFSDVGDGVIIQPPVFFDFKDIIVENKRSVVENPLVLHRGRYVMDFDGLEKLARDPANKLLILCNPHNPVGRVWSRDELVRLGDICVAHDVVVISDEIHGDITFPGHPYTPFASLGEAYADNAIICLSPAKSFNIAACCSAFTLVANEARRKMFMVENSRLTVNKNNAFANVSMTAAYGQGGVWLDQVLQYVSNNLGLVREALCDIEGVELIEPDGTFLLWFDFRGLKFSPDELTKFLREKAGWAITRGQSFGVEGEGFGRVNIACQTSVLQKALSDLRKAVSGL